VRGVKVWLLLVCTVAAANQAAYAALRVLITYRALDLGLGVVAVGVLAATIAVTPALVAIPVGRLVDRGAARATILWSAALMVVSGVVIATGATVGLLVLGSIVLSVAQGGGTVAGQGYVSIGSVRSDLDRHFAAWSLSTNLGQIVGLAIVALTFTLWESGARASTISMASVALCGLAAASCPIAMVLPRVAQVRRQEGHRPAPFRQLLRTQGMTTALFASMVILAGVDLLVVYLPVLGEQYGISVQAVAVLLACRVTASMAARVALPHVLTRVPRRAVLVSSTMCSGVALLTLPWAAHSSALLALCLVAIGVFWGFGQPMTMTWVVSIVPASEQGVVLGMRTLANNVAQTALPLGAGLLAGSLGIGTVFVLAGVVSLLATAGTARQL
jgi:MFS family permease